VFVVGALAIVLLFAPLVGIQRAIKRRRLRQRSAGALVLSAIAALASLVLALTQLTPLYAVGLVLLNFFWLASVVSSNREASRRRALAEPPR
jgi:Ca2+/Na+ antiporter